MPASENVTWKNFVKYPTLSPEMWCLRSSTLEEKISLAYGFSLQIQLQENSSTAREELSPSQDVSSEGNQVRVGGQFCLSMTVPLTASFHVCQVSNLIITHKFCPIQWPFLMNRITYFFMLVTRSYSWGFFTSFFSLSLGPAPVTSSQIYPSVWVMAPPEASTPAGKMDLKASSNEVGGGSLRWVLISCQAVVVQPPNQLYK